MFNVARVRASFPGVERSTYLNTAGAGLSWSGQGSAAAAFYDVAKANGIGGAPDWAAKAEATKQQLAGILGVPARRIQFVGSTTEALNLIALALPLGRGDRVLVADDEFPSVVLPWLTLQRDGVELERIPIRREDERTEALCAAVKRRARVLAVSHVHWRTGTRVDLARLRQVCREHDCRLIVDGVQAVGAVATDADCADAYCASVFKWLLSGFGLGFVTLSDRLAAELTPALRGYANEVPSRSIQYGHINYPGIYALHDTLEFLDTVGWENIYRRVALLAQHSMKALRERGFDVVTPDFAHAGVVSLHHPATTELVRTLAGQSIYVEDGSPIVRASAHFYNTEEEIDRYVEALHDAVSQKRRTPAVR